MNKSLTIFLIVITAFTILCVRPAHAEGAFYPLLTGYAGPGCCGPFYPAAPNRWTPQVACAAVYSGVGAVGLVYSSSGVTGWCGTQHYGAVSMGWQNTANGVCDTSGNCTCNTGFIASSDTYTCVANTTCPHTYLGIETARGYGFSTTNHSAYQGCDSNACQVNVDVIGTVFGVSLLHQAGTSTACSSGSANSSLTVTITNLPDPQVTNFNAVAAAAPAVDSSVVSPVVADLTNSAAVLASSTAALTVSTAAVSSKSNEVQNKLSVIQSAANSLMAAPSPAKLTTYNDAVNDYNTSVAQLAPLVTKMNSDYSIASNAVANSQGSSGKAVQISQAKTVLDTALAQSGQPFDQSQINAITTSINNMNSVLAAAQAQMTAAAAQKASASTVTNTVNNNTVNNSTYTTNTSSVINNIVTAALPSSPPPTPPVVPPVPPKLPDTNPFCVDNPTASVCVPAVDFCDKHPNSAACAPAFPFNDVASVLGTVPAAETIPSSTPEFSTAPVSFATASGCPAPVSFNLTMPFLTKTFSVSYQPLCDVASAMRPIFLALSAVMAAFIFAAGLSI